VKIKKVISFPSVYETREEACRRPIWLAYFLMHSQRQVELLMKMKMSAVGDRMLLSMWGGLQRLGLAEAQERQTSLGRSRAKVYRLA